MYICLIVSLIFNVIFILLLINQRMILEDFIYKYREKENNNSLFDIDRMEEALNSESFTMPSNLSREQKRKFIIDCANSTTPVPFEDIK